MQAKCKTTMRCSIRHSGIQVFFFFLVVYLIVAGIVQLWHKLIICKTENESAHEIMALFVLRKLILQTRTRSHPVGLDVWCLVGPFVYFQTSCLRTTKALARLRGCAGSPEPSLVAYVISTVISCAGSINVFVREKISFTSHQNQDISCKFSIIIWSSYQCNGYLSRSVPYL